MFLQRASFVAFTARPTTHLTRNAGIKSIRMNSTHPSLSIVSTPEAPGAIGPYSQAIKVGDLLFASGCIPIDPASGEIVKGGVEEQAKQALKNLTAVVTAGGSGMGKVVKTTVFLKDMNDFGAVNGVYAAAFGDHKPARSLVEVSRLPKDVLFEVECIASLK
ncbi:Endoribonuclease L-PSP/chorismate mutase-like protein [Rhodocollybia butyracea]|uniref:Endoribonuclease L-PSP/chorismate mutase-like protein n=1 Tax=Rhodocollybia butyracea TaxID=206335 RepID=A0A9P5U615_9AGAR|nr:Endoribonuclease L-PSP/chorismate mutase-like protein [Rhodocollybia butyracea]